MKHRLLEWTLTKASGPDGDRYAAMLPRMERSVPRTERGVELVRRLCEDERWAARYLAARAVGRMVPDLIEVDEAWRRLLAMAVDESPIVREAVPVGIAALVQREPSAGERLERLLDDGAAPRLARRAGLRSLVALTLSPGTRALGERLLRAAALAGPDAHHGVGAVILGRGIGARDPEHARRIAAEWAASPEAPLREQAARASRGALADAEAGGKPEGAIRSIKRHATTTEVA
ncbi:MAG TPA: hypothetical protein VMY78_09045 [Solirubrobacteraceae bacterium]|nr:hypothetical protein [Solirubrobacteraceae bacterium]